VDPRAAAELVPSQVGHLLGAEPDLRTTVVRYQPEASATVRLDGDHRTVFAKHLADGGVAEVGARHEALWSMAEATPALLIAEPLAVDPEHAVLWTRGVPGDPLTAAVAPTDLPGLMAAVGTLLAALHGSAVDVPQRLTVDDLLAEAAKKAAKIARAHPPIAALVSELVGTATSRRGDVTEERDRTLHGDFHLDQLVDSPRGPVLVDLDSMLRGAPEIDLAEFLVDLALRGLPEHVVPDVGRRVLASYAEASGIDADPALLAICADAEFVNRCYRRLRHHAPGWRSDLEAELGRHDAVRLLLQG
jgi:hypothetical protein